MGEAQMNNTDLPPLPPMGATGPDVCAIVRLYIAVLHDLNPHQIRAVTGHLQICPDCAYEQRLVSHATQSVAGLPASRPSARVDQAVMAAIAARSYNQASGSQSAPTFIRPATTYRSRPRRARRIGLAGLASAAIILIAATAS